MMADDLCIIHFTTTLACSETVTRLTRDKLIKIVSSAKLWLDTDKYPERNIAERVLEKYEHLETVATTDQQGDADEATVVEDICCHKQCYLRFASESKVSQASKASKRKVCVGSFVD